MRATPTKELRAERDRLQSELDQAPPDRRRVVERAVQRREQAEQQLTAVQAKHPGDGRRWFARHHGEHHQDPAARALAARQAERAAKAEVEARTAQQHHQAWIEDHHEDGHSYREVARELALRSRQRAAFAELEQPAYLTDTLGPVPESVRGRRCWRHSARLVEDYRQRFQVDDPARPLGEPPARHDTDRHQAWRQASDAIGRMQARQQRQLEHDRDQHRQVDQDPTPGSVERIADRHGGKQPTSLQAPTREPLPVQGPEREAG